MSDNLIQADVVIIGGGVIGSACAYFLSVSDDFTGTVAVIEKDTSYQYSSTALSAGGIRQQFSTPENIQMSQFAIEFLRNAGALLSVNDEPAMIPFTPQGYLLMATDSGHDILSENVAVQNALGSTTKLLDAPSLKNTFSWLNCDDLAGGSLGGTDEGWTDPYALLQAFKRKARSLGATYITDTVSGLTHQSGTVSAVHLESGQTIKTGFVVNAAGPNANNIASMAGLNIPVEPRKRYVYVFDCPTGPRDAPLSVDPSGVYFRPEGQHFICGQSPAADEDTIAEDFDVDYGFFEQEIWPILANRVPAFETLKQTSAWAGHYAYNTFDQNALLGPHTGCSNLLFANGFSGHGLQQSPAVGRAISELIMHGKYTSLDLSRFSVNRVAGNKPIFEKNVI